MSKKECFHIVERFPSMVSRPALRRCFSSRKTAETVARRGATGDRSNYRLVPSGERPIGLGVVACYGDGCECANWPEGHNAVQLAPRAPKPMLACEDCGQDRRELTELVDPKTGEPTLLCNRCFERTAGKLLRRNQWAQNVRRHADDPPG